MKLARTLWLHTGLLALGGAAATWAYTRDKAPGVENEAETTILSGRAANVQRIVYESKDKKAVLEAQADKDKKGELFYLVTFEKTPPAPSGHPDAGATPPPAKTTTVFPASEAAAKKLVESVAPLKAVRSMGKLPEGKASEYGLDKKETSLTITLSGLERKFLLGDTAPGGSDQYVLDSSTGQAYVINGEHVRDLEMAESRLMEHDVHSWKETEVTSAKIAGGGKTREVVRGGADSRRFWADPAAKDKADETVVNWMQKVDRLKPSEYLQKDPENRTTVVRVDYTGAGPLGFFELAKSPDPAQPGKSLYFIMSERTHKYAKVTGLLAEQIEQDLGALLK
jgi:hypothetical protein